MTKGTFKLDSPAAETAQRQSVAKSEASDIVLENMSGMEGEASDKKNESEADIPNKKVIGFFELYRFATGLEVFWCIVAFCCALIAGTQVTLWAYLGSTAITDYYNINQTFNESNQMAEDHYQQQVKDIAVGLFEGYFVTMFIVLFTSGINMGLFVWVADRVTKRIREAAFRNILRQHMGYFDTHNTGELIGILAEDVNKVQSGMAEKMATTSQWLGQFLSSVIVSFLGSWVLSLCAYVLLPFAVASGMLTANATQRLSKKQILAYGEAGTVAEESLSAIRMVVAFGGEVKQGIRYRLNLTAARKVGSKIGMASAGGQSFTHFVTLMVIAVTFGIGGLAFIDGKITAPGVIFQVMLCSAMSMRTLSWITMNSEFISQSRAAAYGIYQLIDAKSEIDPSSPDGKMPKKCQGNVTFENIIFEYPNRRGAHVLNGLNLTIPAGKNIALVGPSGCGKSTTIQLLQRYYDPLQGRVLVDGVDAKELNVLWLRNQIGVVSQEPVLFATSIEENIRFGRPDSTNAEVVSCAKEADAHDFIMKLPNQYETVINEMGTLLSRGEKQRISLARALIRNPTILLLDECTSALDNESELVVQNALEKASTGRTTITIAHRLSTVRHCDILFCINEGINWEHGSHDELIAKGGLYSRLVANQMKGQKLEREANKVEEAFDEKRSRASSVSSIQSIYEEMDEKIRLAQEGAVVEKAPLSRIFKLNSEEWPYLVTGMVGAVFMGAGFPLAAIILGTLIEIFGMTNTDDMVHQLNVSVTALCIIAVLSALGGFSAVAALKYAGEWLTLRVRSMAFDSILRQEIGWFDRKENQTGALTSKLANEASRVQQATGTVIVAVFAGLTTIIGAVIIALAFGWQLGVPCLLYVPVIISVSLAQAIITTKYAAWAQEATMEGGKIVAETIDKIRVVASLTKEDFFTGNFNRFFEDLAVKNVKKAKIVGCTWGLTYFLMGGTFVLTFPLGMYWVGMGVIDFENIFRIFYGVAMATYEFARINAYMTEFSGARAAAAELFKIIDRKSEINIDDDVGEKPPTSAGALSLEDVSFRYPTRKEVRVLRRFSVACSRGQFIAMVGPSGSGKSTAIQLFERFYDAMSGVVKLDNVDVRDLNLKWLREQMGIVTQDPILFNISLQENIAFGDNTREVPMEDIIQAAKCANIHSFIASTPKGYQTNAGSKGTQLSGGQKQRVSIARALVRNPKLLLLDDATSALDSESEKVVEEALANAREGRTSIMVSHRLSSIIHADMIYYVDGGQVLEKGTHVELMSLRSHYYNLQQANMGLG